MDGQHGDAHRSTSEIEKLRSLLVGPEQGRIEDVEQSLSDLEVTADKVAEVLPSAVGQRMCSDDQLARSLAPTIEQALEVSIECNPEKLSDALSPLMLSAIRKSVARQIKAVFRSLNRMLEIGFSLRGLRWRLESVRTGRPYSEVVFLRSLVFRVEHVFLIRRRSGQLLVESGIKDRLFDCETTAILSVVRNHVRELTVDDTQETNLITIEYEEHTIWIEPGERMVLAAVIRGTAPVQFRGTLRNTLQQLHRIHSSDLDRFSGDTSSFEASESTLAGCCRTATKERIDRAFSPIFGMVVVALLAGTAYWVVRHWTERAREHELVRLLDIEPGIVVTRTENTSKGLEITLLKDPLADDPTRWIDVVHLDPARVHMKSSAYRSLDRVLLDKKLGQLLSIPPGAQVAYDPSGFLVATGSASRDWVETAGPRALEVFGLPLDASGLELHELSLLQRRIRRVEDERIPLSSSAPDDSCFEATELVDQLVDLDTVLARENVFADVEVRIHTFTEQHDDQFRDSAAQWAVQLNERLDESVGNPRNYRLVAGAPADRIRPVHRVDVPNDAAGVLIFEVRVRR